MLVTSCEQRPATVWNASAMPIFLELHGTWMATLSRTCARARPAVAPRARRTPAVKPSALPLFGAAALQHRRLLVAFVSGVQRGRRPQSETQSGTQNPGVASELASR